MEKVRETVEPVEIIDPSDPLEAAEAAGLYYVMDGQPGYTRKRWGRGFVYLDPAGQRVTSQRLLERFKSLVIPPAWTEVWICRKRNGHIQATGRDAKGRKQYRYHPQWSEVRSQSKFNRITAFGAALPAIRARVEQDLRGRKLTREKVTALVVRLLEDTLVRVGNQEYARNNNSFGLTTLLDDHVNVDGSKMKITFVGKRGKHFELDLKNRRLARMVKRCQELPGQQLFQYVDEDGGCCQTITSGDVNDYLRETTGQDFSAKDFRTWGGTVLAAAELFEMGPAEDEKDADRRIVRAVKAVAKSLGNTPTVCRKYYIHPKVLEAFRSGRLFEVMGDRGFPQDGTGLSKDERAVLRLLNA